MKQKISEIQAAIEPYRQQIFSHPVYSAIRSLDQLKIFMEYHVYAVWDFMSLLKGLQIQLTCTTLPWYPVGNGDTRFFINEIVTGEESDLDENGKRRSHYEMYLDAMQQSGADTRSIETFIKTLRSTGDFEKAFIAAGTPLAARNFVNNTFEIINGQSPELLASAFTFGREDLIPGMFLAIVNDLNKQFPGQVSSYKYYLDRHIEMDGDHHSHLAMSMTSELCANDDAKWEAAKQTAIRSLKSRIGLWDAVYESIREVVPAP